MCVFAAAWSFILLLGCEKLAFSICQFQCQQLACKIKTEKCIYCVQALLETWDSLMKTVNCVGSLSLF